jgi:hypothetical protein
MVFVWAVIIYAGVLALTFIKTISEVLRNHTIGHKASLIDFNCVQTPLSLIKRQCRYFYIFKKSPPSGLTRTSNCVCKYRMYKNKQGM